MQKSGSVKLLIVKVLENKCAGWGGWGVPPPPFTKKTH